MKPTPPDQERVELIINGDDPESHRAAQETARILVAPQIAQTIQKKIDNCRRKISTVVSLIGWCESVNVMEEKDRKSIHAEIEARYLDLIQRMNMEEYDDFYKTMTVYKLTNKSREVRRELAPLLRAYLPELQDELKKYEELLDDIFSLVRGK